MSAPTETADPMSQLLSTLRVMGMTAIFVWTKGARGPVAEKWSSDGPWEEKHRFRGSRVLAKRA